MATSTSGMGNVVNANSLPTEGTANRTPSSDLGKDEFLQILAVQLSNQDPLEPTSDTDFIAQMAQFTSLEQMQAMAASTESSQAYNLIGKDVLATVTDEKGLSQQIVGRVESVRRSNNTEYVVMGTYLVPLKSVVQVYDSGMTKDTVFAQAASYIGKFVEGEIPTNKVDSSGNVVYDKVSGEVEYVFKNDSDGLMYVKLKDDSKNKDVKIMVNYLTQVGGQPVKTDAAENAPSTDTGEGESTEKV